MELTKKLELGLIKYGAYLEFPILFLYSFEMKKLTKMTWEGQESKIWLIISWV